MTTRSQLHILGTGGCTKYILLLSLSLQTLVQHGCDVNSPDENGRTSLHKAIVDGDEYAASFLIENGADLRAVTSNTHETPLHLSTSNMVRQRFLGSVGLTCVCCLDSEELEGTQLPSCSKKKGISGHCLHQDVNLCLP